MASRGVAAMAGMPRGGLQRGARSRVGVGRAGAGGSGVLLVALVFAALFASLSAVVWRQSRAMEALRGVEQLRTEASLLEARRAGLARQVQQLERRARVLSVARERLNMRLPGSEEIVILPLTTAAVNGVAR